MVAAGVFSDCTALASVTLPVTLRLIDWCAFSGCSALAAIVVPKGCTVHEYAFIGTKTDVSEL
jgi:hypothetical protein